MSDNTFGNRLALIRVRMDWNLKEAAKECGVAAASWRSWERGGTAPRSPLDAVEAISKRTGCDYLWLLTGRAYVEKMPLQDFSMEIVQPEDRKRKEPTAGYTRAARDLVASGARVRPPSRPSATTRPPSVPSTGRRPKVLIGNPTR